MVVFTKFYARSFELDSVTIFWEIEDISKEDDIYAFSMELFKSEAYNGPYDKVAGPFFNIFQYRDSLNLEDHKNRNIYYKLKVTDIRTNESIMVGPTAQLPEPDLIAMEVIRQEDMLFRNFIGRRCYVFPRKTFGQICICVQPQQMRGQISNCKTCYGTLYLGGFNSPTACYIQFDPNSRSTQLTPAINHSINMTTCRLIAFPPLNTGDMIVDPENHRWRVTQVQVTRRLSYDLHQECQVKEILRGDIEYEVPVLDDIKKVDDIFDWRNRVNPTTFEYKPKPNYEGRKPDGLV